MAKEDSGTMGSEPGVFHLGGLDIKKLDQHPPSDKLNQKCPHKKTDFRYKIWVKERKVRTVLLLHIYKILLLSKQNN